MSNAFAGGFQDNISVLNDRLIAVVGGRYDTVQTNSYSFDSAQSIAQKKFVKNPASVSTVDNQDRTYRYGRVIESVPPPPPAPASAEAVSAPPAPNALWVPGYWSFDGARYTWIAGQWEIPPPNARAQ